MHIHGGSYGWMDEVHGWIVEECIFMENGVDLWMDEECISMENRVDGSMKSPYP